MDGVVSVPPDIRLTAGLDRRVAYVMEIEVIPAADRDAAATAWQVVETAAGTGLTCSWDWVETWLNHFGDLVPHAFVVGLNANGPRGIALLTRGVGQRRGPFGIATIHLGTAGEPPADSVCVEYNRLLVAPQDRAAFVAGLLRAIRTGDVAWDALVLNGLVPEDAEPFLCLEPGFLVERRVCHVVDLRAVRKTSGTVMQALPKSTAAKVRKNQRRFEERYGAIGSSWAASAAEGLAMLDELIPLHQDRWLRVGKPGSFASDRFTAFHRELIGRLLPKGDAVLFRVTAGDQTLGIFYGLVDAGVLYHYQWGLAHFDDNSLSPGFVVGACCMEAALARGLDELNWLAGDTRYKREMATAQRELIWAELQRGPRMRLIETLRRLRGWQRSRSPRPATSTGGSR
jgi:CelD/BcsL family acetyltransferase involved in cellulose biosynthesis